VLSERALGSVFGSNSPQYSWLWKEQAKSEVSGCWRDAEKLLRNVGKST